MDALERVEVAVRTQLVCHFSTIHGAFGYLDRNKLPGLNHAKYTQWMTESAGEIKRSKEAFVTHFKNKYGDKHTMPPIWMLAELMSFGRMLTFFNGVDATIRSNIAKEYRVPDAVLRSWLLALNVVRNICAHQGRLWNQELPLSCLPIIVS